MTFQQRMQLNRLQPFWAIIALFLIPVVFQGCSTFKEKKLEREGLTLIYRNKMKAGPAVSKLSMNHPIIISEKEFKNHLYSLQYEELSLLGKKRYVISLTDLKDITQILTKAVNRMTPENILVFELETSRGKTIGEIFRSGNRLNFLFDSIKGREFSSASFGAGGAISWRGKGTHWRMVPVKGQRFQVTKKILGTSTQENWIVAKMTLPQTSRRIRKMQRSQVSKAPAASVRRPSAPTLSAPPPPDPIAPTSGNNQELEKKLRFLKNLRKKELIDDEEYELKRKELLDSFL